MARDPYYRFTSIGRRLDPAYPTNRAVLLILPVAGLLGSLAAGIRGAGIADIILAGVIGVGVAFGSWALARELAPDDDRAAFISMAFAIAASLAFGSPSLLLLFTALLLVRIVARTTGLPARMTDSLLVAAAVLVTMYVTRSPLLGIVGALAFALDAALPQPSRRQWAFSGLCLAGFGFWTWQQGTEPNLALHVGAAVGVVAIVSAGHALAVLRTRRVATPGDATGVPLTPARVRGGMVVGWLIAAQAQLLDLADLRLASAVWAALAGVAVGSLLGLPKRG